MTCEGRMFALLAVIWSGGFWKDGAVLERGGYKRDEWVRAKQYIISTCQILNLKFFIRSPIYELAILNIH